MAEPARPLLPLAAGRLAMGVFLASLGVFFAASLAMYAYVRYGGPKVPPAGAVRIPALLWTSTAFLLAASATLEAAHAAVKRERQQRFRTLLAASLALAVGFVAVQVPALKALLAAQSQAKSECVGAGELGFDWDPKFAAEIERNAGPREAQIYLAAAALVALHALHVLGGLVPLTIVAARGWRGAYDHECHRGVTACVWYWHFLDGVWLVLLASFHALA